MRATIGSILSILLGIGTLLLGTGLQGTVLALRAGIEHFSDTVTGVVMSAYFVGFIVGTFYCPPLIRRVGHIRAFTAMAAVASSAAIAHGLLIHPLIWALLRMVTGACVVGLYMVVESWLNVLVPNELRGRVFSVYMAVTLLALGAGQFLILVGDLHGFIPFGLMSMLLSLALVPVALTRVPQPAPVEAPALGLKFLYAKSPLGVIGTFGAGVVAGAFWGMGPLFAHHSGLSTVGVAGFMSATIVGGALLQWPIGHASDRMDRRSVLMLVCLLAGAMALLTFAAAWLSPWAVFVGTFLFGGFSFTVYGLSVAHTNDYLEPGQVLEATRGLLLLYGAGAVIGPLLAGVVMQRLGPVSLMLFFAVVMLTLGFYTLYRMRVRAPVPTEAQTEFVPMVRTSPVVLEMDPRSEEERPAAAPRGEEKGG